MGDEFRNHVTRLVAGTMQLQEGLPIDAASELAPALADMESSLESLAGLVKCLDAVMKPGEQVISDLDDVIGRALKLARPWLPAQIRILVSGRTGAVRNRSGAVECALAAMIVSLARSSPPVPVTRELKIDVFSARGVFAVEIESDGARPGAELALGAGRAAGGAGRRNARAVPRPGRGQPPVSMKRF